MSIQVNCSCGQEFRFNDNAAGKKTKCRNCGAVIKIASLEHSPSADDEHDFSKRLGSALELAKEAAEVFPEVEQMHLARSGEISRGPAPCPFCGEPVCRSVAKCPHCQESLRVGFCALCGVKAEAPEKASRTKKNKCRCKAFPVIWGSGRHGAICINCGRAWNERPGRALRWATDADKNPTLTCPWCELDRILDQEQAAKQRDRHVAGNMGLASTEEQPRKRRTDDERLSKLEGLIESVQTSLQDASREARQQKAANMVSSGISAVFWNTILGPFGTGIAALSHQRRDQEIENETGAEKLQSRLVALKLLCKRFCLGTGYQPRQESWLEKIKNRF